MEEGSGPQLPAASGSANEGAAAVLTPLTVTLTGVLFQRPSLVHANADPTADDVEFSDLLQLFHDDTPSFMRNCLGWSDRRERSTWTLSLVKQESMPEERSSTCRTDDNVLFHASFEVPDELQSDIHVLYEILELPARHIYLEPGEIEKPLVQRAVWRHVSTLGLPCSDSALRHVRHLLAAAFSASSPLPRLLLFHSIINSIINVPFTNVDGMFLADVLAPETLGEQIASRCASLSYLALHADYSGSFINSLVETLSSQNCNIKQLLLPNVSRENKNIVGSLGRILQDPRCSLTRLHIGAADQENFLRPLLEGGLDRNTSLTDLGLDMAEVTHVDEFIGSRLHTRIRTLRRILYRMLVGEDPNCTIQHLDLSWTYFDSSSNILLSMLIDIPQLSKP